MKPWQNILATLPILSACPGGSNPSPVINSISATPSSLAHDNQQLFVADTDNQTICRIR